MLKPLRISLLVVLIQHSSLIIPDYVFAGPGDTIKVQTFTFGSPQEGWFVLPSDSLSFRKVLMLYTLKCNPNQNPKCGEWDYLTYTYHLNEAVKDSLPTTGYSYAVNATHPDSFSYISAPQFQLIPLWDYSLINSDTISLNISAPANLGNSSSDLPFATYHPVSRAQILWKQSDLISAGVTAGNITGMQFHISDAGSGMKNFSVRIKSSELDSLTSTTYENSGFTEVYSMTSLVMDTGWKEFFFSNPFFWDGISNLVIEVTYNNEEHGTNSIVQGESANYSSMVASSGHDAAIHFDDAQYVSIPKEAFASVDSQITISFWFKGDVQNPLQDRTTFEAYDQYNHRILNVHLPWSDGNIYWDAGTGITGGYDRIYKGATADDYMAQWHHWTFTKNTGTGSMKIYRDGVLWHSGTGAIRSMKGVSSFWIGTAFWSSSVSANGTMDELAVWNKELDELTIQDYLHKDLDISHPYYNNLLVYYQFNDFTQNLVYDVSSNDFDGALLSPSPSLIEGKELFRNFTSSHFLPQIKLEQGIFQSVEDSVLIMDTMWIDPVSLILFDDTLNPGIATDTQQVWLPYYQYEYDANGILGDSLWIGEDTTIHLETISYWVYDVPVIERFELGRYITPYGIGLDLGEGWTWTFDLSDYVTLLHDSVFLTAGNWQELLDLQFLFIEGTPPRDVLGIQNLWQGNYGWHPNTNSELAEKSILIPSDAFNSRLKLRITGHGADNNNCAEFCTNHAHIKVDGDEKYSREIWRSDCSLNPLYPQGGTWIFQRANWCPGAEVTTFDFELTPFVTQGFNANLDLDLDYYSGSGGANYVTESQLVTYSAPNFTLDAEVLDIISPTNDQMYLRENPICNNPLIVIRNGGSAPLTSLVINYGIEGLTPSVYQWTGNLEFLDTAQVRLGTMFPPGQATSNKFIVSISNPNGGADENTLNDESSAYFNFPPEYPSSITIELKTNKHPWDNEYKITDDQGNLIFEKDNLDVSTTYKDTLELAEGCYTFRLTDTGEDGLSFWFFPNYGNGYVRVRNGVTGSIIKTFEDDFGSEVYQEFTVGYYLNTEEIIQVKSTSVNVYPNPSDGEVWVDILLPERKDAEVVVTDITGKVIYNRNFRDILNEGLTIDLSDQPSGMYLLQVGMQDEVITKKILVGR